METSDVKTSAENCEEGSENRQDTVVSDVERNLTRILPETSNGPGVWIPVKCGVRTERGVKTQDAA